MKIPEHIAFSYLLAQFGVQQQYGPAGTGLMIAAGCLPDLDGLTVIAGWKFYRTYHRIVGHGLPLTVLGPALLAQLGSWGLGAGPLMPLWAWLQVALLGHLLSDICFYRWPAQLLWPFSPRGWGFGLVSWNDLVPTATLYGAALVALCWPSLGQVAAATAVGLLLGYLVWRVWHPRPGSEWAAWLMGDWARRAAPFWRWLTGDFVT
jgi:membrane-bound metal-dependent hydrolase YbcI (DUF457 family)